MNLPVHEEAALRALNTDLFLRHKPLAYVKKGEPSETKSIGIYKIGLESL